MNPLSSARDLPLRGRAEALAGRIDDEPVVQGLRRTAQQLSSVAGPSDRFRADLRTRLLAVAAVQSAVPAATPAAAAPARAAVSWRLSSRAGGVAAGAMASVVAVTGVAVASSQSLPGDPFYGVKRTTEALQLRTADGNVERGNAHLDLASTRLREVRGLVLGRDAVRTAAAPPVQTVAVSAPLLIADGAALGAPVAALVRDTLADMDADTLRGQALLDAAFRASSDAAPLRALSRFATRQSDGLEQLLPALPVATRDRARTSLALVAGVGDQAEALLDSPACSEACDPRRAAPTAPPMVPPVANPLEPDVAPTPAPPCGCEPTPEPAPRPTADPQTTGQPAATAEPTPTSTPTPTPTRTPTAEPSPGGSPSRTPLPLPLPPLPLPSPPVPLPPLPLPSLPSVPLVPPPIATVLPTLGPLQPLADPLLPRLVADPAPGAPPAPRD